MELSEIRDLRDWLAVARQMDAVTDVRGAHWDLEIGTISQLNYRRPRPQAMLFDDIVDYPEGSRVLTGSVSDARRTAMTLRLGTEFTDRELVDALQGRSVEWAEQAPKFDPIPVNSAPVFDNVVDGNATDLLAFPVPRWNEIDGGRFIGTGCMVITSDPETGIVNGGAYRMQVQDEGRTATVHAIPGKHGAQHIARWIELDGRAPVTVSLGHDPLLFLLAGIEVPTGISELNYAGAITGSPLEVVTSEVTGLPIPVSSEIVVEGWLDPKLTFPEGPFGEWTGHAITSDTPVIAIDVARVLHRDDPILLGAPPGKPPHDYSYMRTAVKSAMIQDAVQGTGVPGVAGIWAHEAGGGRMFIAVAVEQRYCGHARQVGSLTAQVHAAAYMNRFVVVVDHDVDPTSLEDVIWAMCTRCDPEADIDIMRRSWGSKADPLLVDQSAPYNSRAVIDATRPYERFDEFPMVATASPELLDQVRTKWAHVLGDAPTSHTTGTVQGSTSGTMMDGM